jgi:hypothetical protein
VAARSGDESDEAGDEISVPQHRRDLLQETCKRADANDPMEISVRDLIALWGAKSRGDRISQWTDADSPTTDWLPRRALEK